MFQQKGLQESAGFFPLSSQTPSKTNVILKFLPMPNASKFSRALRKKGTRQSSNTVTWLVQLVGSSMVVSPPVSSESSSNPLWCFITTGWLPRESWNDFLQSPSELGSIRSSTSIRKNQGPHSFTAQLAGLLNFEWKATNGYQTNIIALSKQLFNFRSSN